MSTNRLNELDDLVYYLRKERKYLEFKLSLDDDIVTAEFALDFERRLSKVNRLIEKINGRI
jgi:hypothetical protein